MNAFVPRDARPVADAGFGANAGAVPRVDTAIVIPARNEARRIGACLAALRGQLGPRDLVVLVANNCSDATVARARAALPESALHVVEVQLTQAQGVGTARKIGCAEAMRRAPGLRWLLNTDADCVAAPDWIAASRARLAQVDAVCGAVEPLPEDREILRGMPAEAGQNEANYRAMVLQFYQAIHPEPQNPLPHHGDAPGASLGIRREAYETVGGFGDRRTSEDRDLIRRVRQAGLRVVHADDVRVAASCRLTGRACGGMADALRDRLTGTDYMIDDALPPARWLADHAARGSLPVWPPELPSAQRLRAADLPAQIAALSRILAALAPGAAPQARGEETLADPLRPQRTTGSSAATSVSALSALSGTV
ncbi:MAG: glycosyltransferase [Celeribacter sp.]|jgi:GT2 family glycosyltransferase